MKNIPILLVATTAILGAFFAISYFQDTKVNADAKNKVKIYEKDGFRIVESNGIPDHEIGTFPNPGNPNRISEQKYNYKIPLNPTISPEGFRMPGPPPQDRNNENGERRDPTARRNKSKWRTSRTAAEWRTVGFWSRAKWNSVRSRNGRSVE